MKVPQSTARKDICRENESSQLAECKPDKRNPRASDYKPRKIFFGDRLVHFYGERRVLLHLPEGEAPTMG